MCTVIGFTGYIGSGKNSAADVLVRECGFTALAFADPLRQMAEILNPLFNLPNKHYTLANGTAHYLDILRAVGYDGAKQIPAVREFLQTLGTEAVRGVIGEGTWIGLLVDKVFAVDGDTANFAVTDVRFENEAQMIRTLDGFVVRVIKTGQDRTSDHVSEAGIGADFTIEASTLDELRERVLEVYEHIKVISAKREADTKAESERLAGKYSGIMPIEPDICRSCKEYMMNTTGLSPAEVGAVREETPTVDVPVEEPNQSASLADLEKVWTVEMHTADETPNPNGLLVPEDKQ